MKDSQGEIGRNYRQLASNTKICKLGVSFTIEEDIACFDISMNFTSKVQVLKSS